MTRRNPLFARQKGWPGEIRVAAHVAATLALFLVCLIWPSFANAQTETNVIILGAPGLSGSFDHSTTRPSLPNPLIRFSALGWTPSAQEAESSFVLSEILFIDDRPTARWLGDSSALNSIIAKERGKRVTLSKILEIADEAAHKLAAPDAPFAFAVVEPQDFDSGFVSITIARPQADEIELVGPPACLSHFKETIAVARRNAQPISRRLLERLLLLANDRPGCTVSAEFAAPADGVGRERLFIFAEHDPFTHTARFDNFAPPSLGRKVLYNGAEINGLLFDADSVTLDFLNNFSPGRAYVFVGEYSTYLRQAV